MQEWPEWKGEADKNIEASEKGLMVPPKGCGIPHLLTHNTDSNPSSYLIFSEMVFFVRDGLMGSVIRKPLA